MIQKFKKYLDKTFIFCPKTREILDFKEELLGVLMEKYSELIASGTSAEEAFKVCVKGVDEYKDTIRALEKRKDKDAARAGRVIGALASVAYVLFVSIVYFAVSFGTGRWDATWLTFIIGVVVYAIAGFALLYRWSKNKSRYFVTRYSLLLLTMLATTLVYLTVSLTTRAWSVTWLAYIAGAVAWFALDISFRIKYDVKTYKDVDTVVIVSLVTVLAYLTVSFTTKLWSVSWLVVLGGVFTAVMLVITRRIINLKKLTRGRGGDKSKNEKPQKENVDEEPEKSA